MSDAPMMPSALGIEAVQWFAGEGESLTVRVSGRWRRGRPTWSGQPLLVVEKQGRRHRFPAMPEPPSLTGAAPGTCQMTFSVPACLSPGTDAHGWLQLGGAVVPLPPPVILSEPPAAEPDVPAPQLMAERRLRSAEQAAESARRRAAAAEAAAGEMAVRVQALEHELDQVRGEPQRLNALLLDRERELLAARQRAHAERAIRRELQDLLGARQAPDAVQEQAASELRVRELEDEIEELRRAGDEAEQAAQAAEAARGHAEAKLAEAIAERRSERALIIAGAFRAEQVVANGSAPASVSAPVAGGGAGVDVQLVREERELIEVHRASGNGKSSEPPASAEPPVSVERPAELVPAHDDELVEVLAELREELERLRADAERERRARVAAEAEAAALKRELAEQAARSERAWQAIEQLRDELLSVAAANGNHVDAPVPDGPALVVPEPPQAPAAATMSLEPERFAEALARLRAATPAAEERPPEPEVPVAEEAAPSGPWLERAVRDVARADRPAADQLIAELAPDLQLDRPRIVKRMAAGPIRRALARLARRRAVPPELRDALMAHRTMLELELDSRLALTLAAVVIDRGRTGTESFTIAYQRPEAVDPGLYLQVWERDPSAVRDTAPSGRISATIVCPPAALGAVLAGARPATASIRGDEQPLEFLRAWIDRARSG